MNPTGNTILGTGGGSARFLFVWGSDLKRMEELAADLREPAQ
jgi:hypothetical protein